MAARGGGVLVCGCPCQIAALKTFLEKDYENLITVDFSCHGVSSPKVWRKYLDSFEEKYGSKVVNSKSIATEYKYPLNKLSQKVILENGKSYYETKDDSPFVKGYLQSNIFCRPSCNNCKFKGFSHVSDITLAGFWGMESVDKSMNKKLGISLVMVNSKKGEDFFERAKVKLNFTQVSFDSVKAGKGLSYRKGRLDNIRFFDSETPESNRKLFFDNLDKMPFSEAVEKYILPHGFKAHLKKLARKAIDKARLLKRILNATQCNPTALYQLFRYNTPAELFRGDILIPTPHCIINIKRGAKINKKGVTLLGYKYGLPKSKRETCLSVYKNATLNLGPETRIGYGASIEVGPDDTLTFKGYGGANADLKIACGNHIEFGEGCMIGPKVTIQDSNYHYINMPGYKISRPIIIGDNVWLCSYCTVMSGVKIGDGAVVSAKSFVVHNVPARTMVSGHPAEVIDENVIWKC